MSTQQNANDDEQRPFSWFIPLIFIDTFTYVWRAALVILAYSLIMPKAPTLWTKLERPVSIAVAGIVLAIIASLIRIAASGKNGTYERKNAEKIRSSFNLMLVPLLVYAGYNIFSYFSN